MTKRRTKFSDSENTLDADTQQTGSRQMPDQLASDAEGWVLRG